MDPLDDEEYFSNMAGDMFDAYDQEYSDEESDTINNTQTEGSTTDTIHEMTSPTASSATHTITDTTPPTVVRRSKRRRRENDVVDLIDSEDETDLEQSVIDEETTPRIESSNLSEASRRLAALRRLRQRYETAYSPIHSRHPTKPFEHKPFSQAEILAAENELRKDSILWENDSEEAETSNTGIHATEDATRRNTNNEFSPKKKKNVKNRLVTVRMTARNQPDVLEKIRLVEPIKFAIQKASAVWKIDESHISCTFEGEDLSATTTPLVIGEFEPEEIEDENEDLVIQIDCILK